MGKIADKKRRRGKPTMEEVALTGKLQPRQKMWCDFLLKGHSEKEAGRRVIPQPANEQQIKAWKESPATGEYIKSQGGLPETISERHRLLLQDMYGEIIMRITRDVKENKAIDPKLFELVKEIGDRAELEGSGEPVKERKKTVSFSDLTDLLPEEDRTSLEEEEQQPTKRRRRVIKGDADDE